MVGRRWRRLAWQTQAGAVAEVLGELMLEEERLEQGDPRAKGRTRVAQLRGILDLLQDVTDEAVLHVACPRMGDVRSARAAR